MKRFEMSVPVGLLFGGIALTAAMKLEGLSLRFLWQPQAVLVVLGGLIGALIIRCGAAEMFAVVRSTLRLFRKDTPDDHESTIARLAWLARSSRREGFHLLERYGDTSPDPLIKCGLSLAADYTEPNIIRAALENLLDDEEELGRRQIGVLEAAGGYAPTFGILGAVLGLVNVLRGLDHPGMLGAGIATAFVATIYGIAIANLLLFPLAGRLRQRHETLLRRRHALAEVLLAICAHESPVTIMRRFSNQSSPKPAGEIWRSQKLG